ncbi:hypothetical protein [Haloarcula salinisoli]|uniref:Uncharacterized protein n=1 Tax=Haloarcula salinisoli TaxID=2487746 RepID=A0A8J7YIM6_9EURY|nr:hypothetical protein [Halomicroarcula salinisoli]MBX0303394.1 hypothetical protein [Halomicroarcula salinisoli]
MDRREYVAATVGLLTAGSAGCLRLSSADTGTPSANRTAAAATQTQTGTAPDRGDEETNARADTVPEWAGWIPASGLQNSGRSLFSIDVETAAASFPSEDIERYEITDTSTRYGGETEVTREVFVENSWGNKGAYVYFGSFTEEAVLSYWNKRSPDSEYRGFAIISDKIGISENVVINNKAYDCLDAKYGDTAALGSRESGWERVLAAAAGSTIIEAQAGDLFELRESTLQSDVQLSARTIDPISTETASVQCYLLFDSASTASSVVQDEQQPLVADITDNGETLVSLEQQGPMVVGTFESPEFYYGYPW